MTQQPNIELAIAWTLVGAFIFTVVITLLSLVGWLKIPDKKQQNKLFYILIVQVTVICVSHFGKFLNFSPQLAANQILEQTTYGYWKKFRKNGIGEIKKPSEFSNEYRYSFENVEGALKYYPDQNIYIETNQRGEFPEYRYFFRPIKCDGGLICLYDDLRDMALKVPQKSGKLLLCGKGPNGEFTDFCNVIGL